jgi:antitoxin (DNA-binding transcriptional repressor) of toxin-antitoxin stability system
MEVSLTELRQRLFELADRVLDTGEAIIITRRGARLRISREEPVAQRHSRLAKLRSQPYEIGPTLDPHESPAQWTEIATGVREKRADYAGKPARAAPRRPRGGKPAKRQP